MMIVLHDILDRSAARVPDRLALSYRDSSLTYGELRARTLAVAAGLQRLGVRRGDRVAVQLPNRMELVEIVFACSRIGAICVPVSPTLKARQLRHVLVDSGASLLAIAGALWTQHGTELVDGLGLRAIVFVDDLSDGSRPLGVSCVSFGELGGDSELSPVHVIDRDISSLFYTSGSSGRAKGVAVSHRNIVSGAESVAGYLGNHAEDRILVVLPLSFDYGFSQVTTALLVGGVAMLTNYLSPAALVDEVRARKATGLAAIPTIWNQLALTRWPDPTALELRYITSSGGVLSLPTIRRLTEALPRTTLFSMYGLTEAFRSTYLDPDELVRRPNSIGKAVPNQEVHVVRPDGSLCEPNEMGELVHRGSFVALGYWNDPGMTASRFRALPAALSPEGQCVPEICVWSGDMVRCDEDGFIYYVGRGDQQIKVSGLRVSPTEVEEVIAEVDGVVECVVVGLSHETLGQVVAAAVVPARGARRDLELQIREHCKEQLPSHMVPDVIDVGSDLPRTANGKPDRRAIAMRVGLAQATQRSTG